MLLPRLFLGVGSSILLRSLDKVGLLHRSYHALDKGNFVLVQTIFPIQHLVRILWFYDIVGLSLLSFRFCSNFALWASFCAILR